MIRRIICRFPGIAPIPVQTVAGVHVKTDEQYSRDTELHGQVKGLKPRISARTNYAGFVKKKLVLFLDRDVMNIAKVSANSGIVSEFCAFEFWQSGTRPPPGPITSIDDVGKRAEADVFLDRYDSKSPPEPLDRRLRG